MTGRGEDTNSRAAKREREKSYANPRNIHHRDKAFQPKRSGRKPRGKRGTY